MKTFMYILICILPILWAGCRNKQYDSYFAKKGIPVINIESDSIFLSFRQTKVLADDYWGEYDSVSVLDRITDNKTEQIIVYYSNNVEEADNKAFDMPFPESTDAELRRKINNSYYYVCGRIALVKGVDSYIVMHQIEQPGMDPDDKQVWLFNVKEGRLRSVAHLSWDKCYINTYRKDNLFVSVIMVYANTYMIDYLPLNRLKNVPPKGVMLYNRYLVKEDGHVEILDY